VGVSQVAKARRIGLFGGSFDPIHIGHLALAQAAKLALPLDEVVFLPAGQPWQKVNSSMTAAEHRLAMVQLAIAGLDGLSVDDREIRRAGPTFTIDTVRELRAEHGPAACLVLLIGSDQFHALTSWKDWTGLLNYVNIATTQRESVRLEHFSPDLEQWLQQVGCDSLNSTEQEPATHGRVVFFRMPTTAVSSTAIRRHSLAHPQAHSDLATLVPGSVLHYIQAHHLYSPDRPRLT
jgi:nicotinate-nucleotide adenylyltransferase